MSSWVRSSYAFDVPWVSFSIGQRTVLARQLHCLLGDAQTPDRLCDEITRLIEQTRPRLKGCVIVAIDVRLYSGVFEVQVIHPSLPRHTQGSVGPSYLLEPCHRCGKDIVKDDISQTWRVFIQDDPNSRGPYEVIVCSEECANGISQEVE
jgi:hypothetical protein